MSGERGRPKLPPKLPIGIKNPFIGGGRQVHTGVGRPKSTLANRVSFWDKMSGKVSSFLMGTGNKYTPHQGPEERARRVRQRT